jgi:hypothetical protein
MYLAYVRRHDGDTAGALAAVDSAWAMATNDVGRRAIDSVRVGEFGLEPLLAQSGESPDSVNK